MHKLHNLKAGIQKISATASLDLRKKKFMIGSVEYEPNDTQAYFTFTLVNSWPAVNDNIVGFSAKTIERSFGTTKHNPIDVDHKIEGNGIPLMDGNQIIGHMVDSFTETENGITRIVVAGVLYKRIAQARDIITDIASGGNEWKISMEVLYSPAESGFMLADNTFIPLEAAQEDLVNAFQARSPIYNGQQYAFLAGGTGEEGEGANVNFWGAALTMTPADQNATVHTMVARKSDTSVEALFGASSPRLIIVSDGPVESTRLFVDGAEIDELMDVEFMNWPNWEKEVWLQWTTAPQDIGGVMKNSRYTLIANEIIGDIGMIKIKELLDGLPGQISEAVNTAVAALKDGETLSLDAVKAVVAEKIGELKDFISPEELDAKAEELANKKIKVRDALAANIASRVKKAEAAGVVMSPQRLKEIASLEDDGLDAWITAEQEKLTAMVASIETEFKVTLGDEHTEALKACSGVDSFEFGVMKSAIGMLVKGGVSLKSSNDISVEGDNEDSSSGLS